MRGVLVLGFVCLVAGLWVLFAFCHGTAGLQFAAPVSAASLHVDITTTGVPLLVGLGLAAFGGLLLFIATAVAAGGLIASRRSGAPLKRRESAFEE